MIETLAKKITNKFVDNNIIKSEDREIYNYCFEATIFTGIGYLILLLLSIAFNETLASFIFLLSFISFRKTCGGYHAKNYSICGLMSLLSYLFLILVTKEINIIFNISYFLLIIGLLIILILSPIQDDNKPFTDKQYKRFKIISKALAAIFIFVFTMLEFSGKNNLLTNKYYFAFCYGIDLVALALLISKVERSIIHAKN
jgi:accessory gene regulator B